MPRLRAKSILASVARRGVSRESSSVGHIDKRLLVEHLPSDPVIVEAGAHAGVDTTEFAALWPGGSVHAFEPLPSVYAKLVRATSRLPNVTTYPCALGS